MLSSNHLLYLRGEPEGGGCGYRIKNICYHIHHKVLTVQKNEILNEYTAQQPYCVSS